MKDANAMTRDALLTCLAKVTDPRFAEAAAILNRVAQEPDLRARVSPRLVPTTELSDIYGTRLESTRSRGVHVAGIAGFVDLLATKPGAAWRMVAVAGGGFAGAVFSTESDDAHACVAGKEARVDGVIQEEPG